MDGETFKYQSRNREMGEGDCLHNCVGGKTQSSCLLSFLTPHNFLDSENGQIFFYMRNGGTQYQLLTASVLGF